MAKPEWENKYTPMQYGIIKLTGHSPKYGLMPEELNGVKAYLSHRGGPPVQHDMSVEPTNFGTRTYLIGGCTVQIQGSYKPLLVTGNQPELEELVEELKSDLHLRPLIR